MKTASSKTKQNPGCLVTGYILTADSRKVLKDAFVQPAKQVSFFKTTCCMHEGCLFTLELSVSNQSKCRKWGHWITKLNMGCINNTVSWTPRWWWLTSRCWGWLEVIVRKQMKRGSLWVSHQSCCCIPKGLCCTAVSRRTPWRWISVK